MIKTVKKVIVLTAMIVLGATSVFAQESNTSIATFGQFYTDVDKFFHANYWKDVDLNGFFGYSRFGANIPAGVLEMGVAAKAGSLYLALYYNGKVIGLQDGTSYNFDTELNFYDNTDPATPPIEKVESLTLAAKNKVNPKATYGALVGVRNIGFKFTLEDNLEVKGIPGSAPSTTLDPITGLPVNIPGSPNSETWTGSITPTLAVGLPGKLYRIILGVPIVYNRTETAEIKGLPTDREGEYVTFETATNKDGSPAADLLKADGNYVGVNIGLRLGGFNIGFTELYVENDLSFNIYGVPGRDLDGKETMYPGVAHVVTNYYPFKDLKTATNPDGENRSDYLAFYDNRFFLNETVTPWFDIVSGDVGKLSYLANFSMPISFTFVNHALNVKYESKYMNYYGGTGGTVKMGKSFEVKDYYQQFNFDMGLSPRIDVGLQFKPADVISLNGGIGLNIFDWTVSSVTTTKVKPPAAPASGNTPSKDYYSATNLLGPNYEGEYSSDTSTTEFEFGYPDLQFALGFTVNFKQHIALDFVYINKFNPSLAGLAYKAIGEGLGSGDTSVVLSIKF